MSVEDGIHFSEISTYLKCNKHHAYSYIDRIEPIQLASQIDFGTFGHKGLEVRFRNGSKEDAKKAIDNLWLEKDLAMKLSPDDRYAFRMLATDAFVASDRAYNWLDGRLVTVTHENETLVERHLVYEKDGITFVGTPDLVAEDKEDGGLWVIDHKFRKMFRDWWSEELNLQMIFYQGLLMRSLGIKTSGTKQFQIKPFAPVIPELTGKGKISKKDCYTTWEIYSAFVESHGEDPADYLDMKEKLGKHVWFDLDDTRTYRNEQEVNDTWENVIIPIAKEIKSEKRRNYRCYDYFTCRNCSFKELCVSDQKDGDSAFILETKFKSKDKPNPEPMTIVIEDEDDDKTDTIEY